MDLELRGKSALVTGASRGLGLSIARALASEGVAVVMNARTPAGLLASVEAVPNAVGLEGDVTDAATCGRLVAETLQTRGRLDILVCNVGSGRSVPPGQETADEWQRVLAVNLLSATNMLAAATEALAASKGVVICLSSICGSAALGAPVTYSAAKAALNAFVRGVARPLGARGVRINAVAPGNLLFEGSVWQQRMLENESGVRAMLESEVALKRLGTPEEIAAWVVFLASPKAAFATGGVFIVDGGQLRS